MDSKLYQLYLDIALDSRKAVYDYLVAQLAQQSTVSDAVIAQEFRKREAAGNIEIAPGVILPHFESADLDSHIVIIRPISTIYWSETVKKVDLIIGLIVSSHGDKASLRHFMKKLADLDFIMALKQKNKVDIKKLLETANGD